MVAAQACLSTGKEAAVRRFLEAVESSLYPPECLLCGRAKGLLPHLDLCQYCRADMPRLGVVCERCAEPLTCCPGSANLCGQCLASPPPYQRTWCLGHYEAGLACLVTLLKFRGRLEAGKLLGQLLGRYMLGHSESRQFALLPVPLHPRRLRRRGFNQSREIARWAARTAKLELLYGSAERCRDTAAQTGLSANERRVNLRRAFKCSADLRGQRIAIVDDVMTTGSTVASLAKTLRAAGCPQVEVWCCARASLGQPGPAGGSAKKRAAESPPGLI